MLDPLSDKAQQAAHMGRLANPANNREGTIEWLEKLGSKFVTVWLYMPGKHGVDGQTGKPIVDWLDERHIDDPETLMTTVSLSLERLGGRYAVWKVPGGWQLFDRLTAERTKRYPSREAAEMVAIHGG